MKHLIWIEHPSGAIAGQFSYRITADVLIKIKSQASSS
jgi:hypothetical protein